MINYSMRQLEHSSERDAVKMLIRAHYKVTDKPNLRTVSTVDCHVGRYCTGWNDHFLMNKFS